MSKYCGEEYECIIDRRPGSDRHHVRSRGAGGTDDDWNLLPICHIHHLEVHVKGLVEFAQKYQEVRIWLREHDWFYNGWKWTREKKEPKEEKEVSQV